MKLYPLYTALTDLYEFYGVEMDEDQFETFAMSAYRKIGNKVTKMKLLKVCPLPDATGGWYVCVPKDCEAIEAITLPFEDAQLTSNITNYEGWYTIPVEETIEAHKRMPDELYIPGKYVKFEEIGDRIYFTEPLPRINILYKGSYNDEEGLPFITDKESEAIACYCAYCFYYRKGIATKDSGTILMAQMLKKDWLLKCNQARISDLNQNQMNLILDVMTNHDRHMYGRTTKPIK